MNKLWLIIKREYLSRVRKKTFILTTILTPIGFVLFIGVVMWLSASGQEDKTFAVLDENNVLQLNSGRSLRETPYVHFKPIQNGLSLDSLKNQYHTMECDAILYLPAQDTSSSIRTVNIEYYSEDQLGVNTLEYIKSIVNEHLRNIKIEKSGIDKSVLLSFDTDVAMLPKSLHPDVQGEQSSYRVYAATFLGGLMMVLIYMVVFIYGTMVMRSVMEEKTSRIVEVIISSVKPFQLMLGKIIGVGAVGLTQFAIWAIVFPLLYIGMGLLFAEQIMASQQAANAGANQGDMVEMMLIAKELWSFNYPKIIFFFILFFLGGYVMYASLFAAVGSAMSEDTGEGQSLMLIITLPVVTAFYIGIAAAQNPNGDLALWSSMFPIFAPVVMPARMVFDPPIWQIFLSLGLLFLTCWFFVWIAGRIYRVGILMYGKKVTLKELAKWLFYKE